MTGAFALALASPSEARNGRNAAAIGGFAAGAVLGAAIANSNNGYYGGPGYYYQEPVYAPGYAYEPAPVYVSPRRGYRGGGCWIATDTSRGYGYYGAC
ncbi:MAG: hypothetical protein NTU64_11660 [Hyphomicrobiales bacterium]|nr:hypothetical protein [Hyphomicrobiales bacterium]